MPLCDGAEKPADRATLSAADSRCLLELAHDAVTHGLNSDIPMAVDLDACVPALRVPQASFVTLHSHGRLRGCIGSLQPRRPLATDVVGNAHAAAFKDPRFTPLTHDELTHLNLSISVLSLPETIASNSEDELIAALRPGVDGLILRLGSEICATFLPAVWEALPDASAFLRHLKAKAGLAESFWSPGLLFQRYTVQKVTVQKVA